MPAHEYLKILLADDDQDDRELFTVVLQEIGIDSAVDMVFNGQELIDYFLSIQSLPELIFIDINMPLKNGLDCLRLLKESELTKEIPIIMYSTTAMPSYVDRAFSDGASLYISKPTSYFEQIKIFQKIFAFSRLQLIKGFSYAEFVLKAN